MGSEPFVIISIPPKNTPRTAIIPIIPVPLIDFHFILSSVILRKLNLNFVN